MSAKLRQIALALGKVLDGYPEMSQGTVDKLASVAAEAMLEPTPAMEAAADNWGRGAHEDWAEAYRVMVRAALQGG